MGQDDLGFAFSFASPRAARRRDDDQPLRILALANLSGRGAGEHAEPLDERKAMAVDVDNLERVFARLAPRLVFPLKSDANPGGTLEIQFGNPEDFHPDRLWRSPAFADLRALRAELQNPATWERAAAALGVTPAATPSPPTADEKEAAADDIQRLLGRAPTAEPPQHGAAAQVQRLLQDIVAPHIVRDTSNLRQPLIAALDEAISARMRAILHAPAFQALQAAWRGVGKLVSGLELGETLQLTLLDVSREELAADVAAAGGDLSRCALYPILCGAAMAAPDDVPWSLIVADFSFGPDADDLALLAALGALGTAAGAPVLAGAKPGLIGCHGGDELANPAAWQPPDHDSATRWRTLRRSATAPWIGLAMPRILGRLPYGAKHDPVEAFAFEEMAADSTHEDFLWIIPAWDLALMAGQAFAEEGWDYDLTGRLNIAELPSYVTRDDEGVAHQQPCAEVLMPEAAGEAILAQGIMAILSYRNRDAARLLRWQSVAEPLQPLAGLPS
ncbi:MAG: type VI secretion system contractile sheath large subunit [Rhodocyclaceae bacterium]